MSLSEKKTSEAQWRPRTFQKVKAGGEMERARIWKETALPVEGPPTLPTLLEGNQTCRALSAGG